MSKGKGILLIGGSDPAIAARAQKHKLAFELGSTGEKIPFDKTLILTAGTRVPWDLLPAAWNFLERWDSAVPLWRYGVTAEDLGSKQERELTRSLVRDLRVLLYSYELLFVRNNSAGRKLIETWRSEMERGSEKRLAFLRAYYQVKPRLCVLPISWLAEVRAQSQSIRARRSVRIQRAMKGGKGKKLVRVEVAPGRVIKCAPEDVERVKAHYAQQAKRG